MNCYTYPDFSPSVFISCCCVYCTKSPMNCYTYPDFSPSVFISCCCVYCTKSSMNCYTYPDFSPRALMSCCCVYCTKSPMNSALKCSVTRAPNFPPNPRLKVKTLQFIFPLQYEFPFYIDTLQWSQVNLVNPGETRPGVGTEVPELLK